MLEEEKEKLKEKFSLFFEDKLQFLEKKFREDLSHIEEMKYEFVDNCLKILNDQPKESEEKILLEDIEKKHEKEHKEEKKNEKENKEEKKIEKEHKDEKKQEKENKEEKQNEKEHKDEKEIIKKMFQKKIKNKNKSIDLTKSKTIKELGIKQRPLKLDKSADRIPIKKKEKNENKIKVLKQSATAANTIHRDRDITDKNHKGKINNINKKNITVNTKGKKDIKKREKTPLKVNNHGNKKEDNKNKEKRDESSILEEKKSMEENKENKLEENKEEEKKENKEEEKEKKEIIIKEKPIIIIPEKIKNSKELSSLYITLQYKFLNRKEKYNLIISLKPIYETYDKNIKFLLDEKINDLKEKEEQINKFLSKYDDIEKYLNTLYNPSKIAFKSLAYITKEEEINLSKKESIPNEITIIFKSLYYLLDEKFEEGISTNKLIEDFISIIFEKHNVKDIKNLISNYVNEHKDLKLNKEKFDNLENLFDSCPNICSPPEISKINRPISYLCFILKEIKEFINLKTSDGVYYYELRNKNNELKEIQKQIEDLKNAENNKNLIQNNKENVEEEKKEDIISEEKKENKLEEEEKKIENQN